VQTIITQVAVCRPAATRGFTPPVWLVSGLAVLQRQGADDDVAHLVPADLEDAEREITHAALILLDESPVTPGYDLPHLREIHHRIFGDIYEWAGQVRTVAIAKGAMFCLPQYIDSSAAVIVGELHDENCLRGLRRDAFVGRLAHYLGEVNALHPFREGNGRRSVPSSGSSPATPDSPSPGSTLIPPATSRPPPRSCVATPNRCARCWTRSREAAPDHPSYARRQV